MAKLVLTNVRLFVGPADLTGQSNKVEIVDAMEEKETTNFGSAAAKEVIAGIESVAIGAEGQWQAGDPGYVDDEMWAARRVIEAYTAGPDGAVVGTAAYLTQAVRLDSKLFGQVGDVMPWTLGAAGSWPLARGMFAQAPGSAITADANGTSVNLGAVPAGQRLYASLHLLSVAGTNTPTIAVTIESDTATNFPTPVTVLTFSTVSAVGSQIIRTATTGNTDTWYRAVFDVNANGGTGMSFLAVIALGIA
jgi:hypothetical protein